MIPPRWVHARLWRRPRETTPRWCGSPWRVFVWPTRWGGTYAALLAALFVFAANYQLALAYAVVFFGAVMGLAAAVLTARSLGSVCLGVTAPPPTPVGGLLTWRIVVERPAQTVLTISWRDPTSGLVQAALPLDARAPQASALVTLIARQRGQRAAPMLTVSTTLPWGLVRAWANWQPEAPAWVYPAPLTDAPPWPETFGTAQNHVASSTQTHSFGLLWAGWRSAADNAPLRRVHVRALARRDDALWVAEREDDTAPQPQEVVLRWQDAVGEDDERKLACLAAWVLRAHAQGIAFALELPGVTLPLGHGTAHRDAVLVALAAWPGRR